MFVVLEYADVAVAPTVMYGEVYLNRDDADAAAREQDSLCAFAGRTWKHKVASVAA